MRIPRLIGPIIWLIAGGSFYLLLPWALSALSPRIGWSNNSPGPWNLSAIVLILGGIVLIGWALGLHFVNAPRGWKVQLTPPHLLTAGPFRHTRNPMYLGGSAIWLGWALVYGSLIILGAFLIFVALVVFVVVPWEERQLEKQFGGEYIRYKNTVARWIPRRSK